MGRSGTYLDLAEASSCELVQYEDLKGLQQARVVCTAHLPRWKLELELHSALHGLPQLGPCRQTPVSESYKV